MSADTNAAAKMDTAMRTLTYGDLVDLKLVAERGLRQVPEILMALRMDNAEGMLDALGSISDAFAFVLAHLELDDLGDDDDEPPEPKGTIVPIERVTRNGGRDDG